MDCVLVADCVYDPSVVGPLVTIIRALLRSGGACVVSIPVARCGGADFISALTHHLMLERRVTVDSRLKGGLDDAVVLESHIYVFRCTTPQGTEN